jgi:hypothetical protein
LRKNSYVRYVAMLFIFRNRSIARMGISSAIIAYHLWSKKILKCPKNRNSIEEPYFKNASRYWLNNYNKLKMECYFIDNRCKAVVELEDIYKHESNCEYKNTVNVLWEFPLTPFDALENNNYYCQTSTTDLIFYFCKTVDNISFSNLIFFSWLNSYDFISFISILLNCLGTYNSYILKGIKN